MYVFIVSFPLISQLSLSVTEEMHMIYFDTVFDMADFSVSLKVGQILITCSVIGHLAYSCVREITFM